MTQNVAQVRCSISGEISGQISTTLKPQGGPPKGTQNHPKTGLGAPGPPRGLQGALPEPCWAHLGPGNLENHVKYEVLAPGVH